MLEFLDVIGMIPMLANAKMERSDLSIGICADAMIPRVANGIPLLNRRVKLEKGFKGLSKLEKANFLDKGAKKPGAKSLDYVKGIVKDGATFLKVLDYHVLQRSAKEKNKQFCVNNKNWSHVLSTIGTDFPMDFPGDDSWDIFPKRPTRPKVKGRPKFKLGTLTKIFNKLSLPLLALECFLEQSIEVNSGEQARLDQIKAKQAQNAMLEIASLKNPSVPQVRTILKRNGLNESLLSNYEVSFLLASIISIQNAKTENKEKNKSKGKGKTKDKSKSGNKGKYVPKKGDWRSLGKKKGQWLKENGYRAEQTKGNNNGSGKIQYEVKDGNGNRIGRIDKNYQVDGKYVPEHVHLDSDAPANIHYYFND